MASDQIKNDLMTNEIIVLKHFLQNKDLLIFRWNLGLYYSRLNCFRNCF